MGELSSVRQGFPVSAISTVLLAYLFRYYWLHRGPAIDSVFKVRHLSVLFSLPIGLIFFFLLFRTGGLFSSLQKKREILHYFISKHVFIIINICSLLNEAFFLKQNVHIAPKLLKSENALRLH